MVFAPTDQSNEASSIERREASTQNDDAGKDWPAEPTFYRKAATLGGAQGQASCEDQVGRGGLFAYTAILCRALAADFECGPLLSLAC